MRKPAFCIFENKDADPGADPELLLPGGPKAEVLNRAAKGERGEYERGLKPPLIRGVVRGPSP